MIGNETFANLLTAIDWSTRENEDGFIRLDSISDIPEGWEYLSSGAYRHAFRGPDGCVYKVHTAFGVARGSVANEVSYTKYLALRAVGAKVAKTDWFTDSNAMVQEYVEGDILDMFENEDEWLAIDKIVFGWGQAASRFIDHHSENFRMVNGEPVLIDW